MFATLVAIVVGLLVVVVFVLAIGIFAPKDVDPMTGLRNRNNK